MEKSVKATIASTIPTLPALDLDAAIAFYARLGFVLRRRYEAEGYAILARDGAELHLWRCDDRHVSENSGCYLRVHGIAALHAAFAAAGVEPGSLIDQPYGQRELHLIDPSGNLLRFGEPIG